MNVDALSSHPSVRASLLAVQATSTPAVPSASQLKADRAAVASTTVTEGKSATPKAATPEDVKKAASQFEAIIIRQLLAPAIEPVMSGGMGGGGDQSSGGGIYGYMLTDVLASSLSQGGGLGWARLLEKQLSSKSEGADNTSKPISKPSTYTSPL